MVSVLLRMRKLFFGIWWLIVIWMCLLIWICLIWIVRILIGMLFLDMVCINVLVRRLCLCNCRLYFGKFWSVFLILFGLVSRVLCLICWCMVYLVWRLCFMGWVRNV